MPNDNTQRNIRGHHNNLLISRNRHFKSNQQQREINMQRRNNVKTWSANNPEHNPNLQKQNKMVLEKKRDININHTRN